MRYTLMVLGLSSVVAVNAACSGSGSPAVSTPATNLNQTSPALFAAPSLERSNAEGVAIRTPSGRGVVFHGRLTARKLRCFAERKLRCFAARETPPLREIPQAGSGTRALARESAVRVQRPRRSLSQPRDYSDLTTCCTARQSAAGRTSPNATHQVVAPSFQLTPPSKGQSTWTETVLYSFSGGADGAEPSARLTLGAHGVLYGTTYAGGANNFGTVFALMPPPPGQTNWTESVLYSFAGGADGGYPFAAVNGSSGLALLDHVEFWRTQCEAWRSACARRCTAKRTGLKPSSTPSVAPGDGAVALDAGFTLAGKHASVDHDLPAAAVASFRSGCGTVYELTPNGQRQSQQWRETIPHDFTGFDGLLPILGADARSRTAHLYASGV